jgi:pyruvate carboxylase
VKSLNFCWTFRQIYCIDLTAHLQILKGAPVVEGRPGASIPLVDFDKLRAELKDKHGSDNIKDTDVLSAALYPKAFDDFFKFRQLYGPVDKLDTRTFFIGPDIAHEMQVMLLIIDIRRLVSIRHLTTTVQFSCSCTVDCSVRLLLRGYVVISICYILLTCCKSSGSFIT